MEKLFVVGFVPASNVTNKSSKTSEKVGYSFFMYWNTCTKIYVLSSLGCKAKSVMNNDNKFLCNQKKNSVKIFAFLQWFCEFFESVFIKGFTVHYTRAYMVLVYADCWIYLEIVSFGKFYVEEMLLLCIRGKILIKYVRWCMGIWGYRNIAGSTITM